eukprot:COSAG01_NODE_770_length_13726_cov_66.211639_13_plen_129_part_01
MRIYALPSAPARADSAPTALLPYRLYSTVRMYSTAVLYGPVPTRYCCTVRYGCTRTWLRKSPQLWTFGDRALGGLWCAGGAAAKAAVVPQRRPYGTPVRTDPTRLLVHMQPVAVRGAHGIHLRSTVLLL